MFDSEAINASLVENRDTRKGYEVMAQKFRPSDLVSHRYQIF